MARIAILARDAVASQGFGAMPRGGAKPTCGMTAVGAKLLFAGMSVVGLNSGKHILFASISPFDPMQTSRLGPARKNGLHSG
jgi:hypothetical protein